MGRQTGRRMQRAWLAGVLSLLAVGPSWAATAAGPRVESLRLAEDGETTRAELRLTRSPDYRLFTLTDPDRVVLDVKGGSLSPAAMPLPKAGGSVREIRAALRSEDPPNKEKVLRLVFDVQGPVQLRDQLTSDPSGTRLLLELTAPGSQSATRSGSTSADSKTVLAVPPVAARVATPAPVAAPVPATPAPTPPPLPKSSPPPPGRPIVIAVDAGHGGHDPGAIGPRGAREKDVTLAISRRLVVLLNDEPGMRGLLTRKGDEFVILRQRMERARAANADLFISIHADAVRNRRVRGASVYVLNEKGASDEAARRLAARENAADLIGGVRLRNKDPVLASVLMDLSQNAAKSSSIAVGDAILDQLATTGRLLKPTVQQAPFMVLKSPDVPSLLVETAFISNPDDERNLRSAAHQDKVAKAILAGIRNYFRANPPRGTVVTAMSGPGQHY